MSANSTLSNRWQAAMSSTAQAPIPTAISILLALQTIFYLLMAIPAFLILTDSDSRENNWTLLVPTALCVLTGASVVGIRRSRDWALTLALALNAIPAAALASVIAITIIGANPAADADPGDSMALLGFITVVACGYGLLTVLLLRHRQVQRRPATAAAGFTKLCIFLFLFAPLLSYAQDPCAGSERRALVLSGGGLKGAFEAGAVYHLVLHRGCDFHDFAGVSAGAMNAAILAQAEPSNDGEKSQRNLQERTEQMTAVWEHLKSSRTVVRHRKLGAIRFALFGAEHMNDFSPLRATLEAAVSVEDLSHGRPLRVGVTSFADGTYREVWINGFNSNVHRTRFMDYLYASSMLPVVARMQRIAPENEDSHGRFTTQFADGGLRHVTPVASYFNACLAESGCREQSDAAAHASLQQLFVIGTSPYKRHSEWFPPADAKCCRPGTQLFTNGSRIMRRAIALVADTPYRADLEAMWMANDLLTWRSKLMNTRADSNAAAIDDAAPAFPLESYNRDPQHPDALSRPYQIVLIAPEKENVDISDLLALTPAMVRAQLLAGCLSANEKMSRQFDLASMADACRARFGEAQQRSATQLASVR